MDKKDLLNKYRRILSFAMALTIVVSSIIEIIAYFIFIRTGRCALSFSDPYLKNHVILPIGLNIGIYLIIFFINRSSRASHAFKNESTILGASTIAFVISVIHMEFIVNTGAFIFPIILSAMFNSKKLIIKTFLLSLFSLIVTVSLSFMARTMDTTRFINYLVMCGFLMVSFFACYIYVKYSQFNTEVIEAQEKTNNHLKNIVLLDPMTGLYNHRTFYAELDRAVQRYAQEAKPFCLAIIDIDKFKHINDKFGHDCGDIVIENLAQLAKSHCGSDAKAFRYGGEEFAILFTNHSLSDAKEILEQIRASFAHITYAFTDERITFSGGIAEFTAAFNRENFFAFVDKLLYQAKESGRNQIQS